jgi:exopolysaccharide production protein ExoZ
MRDVTSAGWRHELLSLQIMRAVAASAVVVHHVLEESQPMVNGEIPKPFVLLGACGVDIFFVISGFIMLYSFGDRFGHAEASSDFLARRLIRIVPLYWFCTFALVALKVSGAFYASLLVSFGNTVASFLFIPLSNPLIGVGWTLNYEMYFYVLFAAALLWGRRLSGIAMIAAAMLLMMTLSARLPTTELRSFFANPIALEFLYGLGVGTALAAVSAFSRRTAWALIGCAALLLALSSIIPDRFTQGTSGLDPSVRFLVWGVPSAMLLAAVLALPPPSSFVARALGRLGDASYSLYLTHSFVMTTYAKIIKLAAPRGASLLFVFASLAIATSIILALAVHHLIEGPLTKGLKRAWATRSGGAVPTPS